MWEEYNTPQLLDEKICDANIIPIYAIDFHKYIKFP